VPDRSLEVGNALIPARPRRAVGRQARERASDLRSLRDAIPSFTRLIRGDRDSCLFFLDNRVGLSSLDGMPWGSGRQVRAGFRPPCSGPRDEWQLFLSRFDPLHCRTLRSHPGVVRWRQASAGAAGIAPASHAQRPAPGRAGVAGSDPAAPRRGHAAEDVTRPHFFDSQTDPTLESPYANGAGLLFR
jgi:hypothetical protein